MMVLSPQPVHPVVWFVISSMSFLAIPFTVSCCELSRAFDWQVYLCGPHTDTAALGPLASLMLLLRLLFSLNGFLL